MTCRWVVGSRIPTFGRRLVITSAVFGLTTVGGAGLALFGSVAASGIRSLSAVHYEGNQNLVIVALSIGMGVIPIAVPEFYEEFPSWFQTIFDSGISASAVTAVLLNIFFNVLGRRNQEAPIFAESPAIGVAPEDQPGGHIPHDPGVEERSSHPAPPSAGPNDPPTDNQGRQK